MHKFIWLILAVGTMAMMMIMRQSGKPLETPFTPAGIINLELARTKSNVRNILNIWSSSNGDNRNNIGIAKNNTYLDFLFILFYASFLFVSTQKVVLLFYKRSRWAALGRSVVYLSPIAAILDVLENLGMLLSLNNHVSSKTVFLTFSCSFMKWLCIGLIILYLLSSLLYKLLKLSSDRNHTSSHRSK